MSTNVKIVISAQDKASNVIANITRQLQQLEMTASQMKPIQIRASGAVSQAVKATSVRIPTSGYKHYTKNVTNSNLADDFYKKAQTPVQNVALGTREIAHNIRKASGSSNILSKRFLSIGGALMLVNRAGRLLGNVLEESGKWIEDINLFKVTFGEASDEAYDFAMTLSKAFGISANEVIRYTGLFKQMTEAIGVAEQTSTQMAKTLTALGYDIAAFYNITTEQAMEKLRAGIAGQTKPLRQLGMDITAQSLDKYMSDKMGLSYTSKQLEQSNKVILRQIIMLEQAKNAYGDMAKTVNSYANQIKVLQGSVDNLKLALGDLFVSDATNIISIINGAIIALTNMIRIIVPLGKGASDTISDVETGLGGVDDELENINKSMNRLSFDKFESLTRNDGKLLGITDLLTDEYYKKQQEYMLEYNKRMEEIANKANEVADAILGWIFPDFKNSGLDFAEWSKDLKSVSNVGKEVNLILKGIFEVLKIIMALAIASKIKALVPLLQGLALQTKLMSMEAKGLSLSTATLKASLEALSGVFLFILIYGLITVISKWKEMSTALKVVSVVLLSVVAALYLYSSGIGLAAFQTIKFTVVALANIIKTLGTYLVAALKSAITWIGSLSASTWGLIGAFAVLTAGIVVLALNWDNMGNWQKVITIFGALAAAAIAAAVAIGVFHASWTMGLGAAAIAAGIALVVGSVASAKSVTKFADGGVPDRGSLFVAGEAGAELVYNMGGGSTGVSNVQQLQNATAGALRQVIVPILHEILDNMNIRSSGNGDVYMDTRKVTDEVYKQGNRVGYWK